MGIEPSPPGRLRLRMGAGAPVGGTQYVISQVLTADGENVPSGISN
jgi:hypothetical protein